jgi:hypothetical protein
MHWWTAECDETQVPSSLDGVTYTFKERRGLVKMGALMAGSPTLQIAKRREAARERRRKMDHH